MVETPSSAALSEKLSDERCEEPLQLHDDVQDDMPIKIRTMTMMPRQPVAQLSLPLLSIAFPNLILFYADRLTPRVSAIKRRTARLGPDSSLNPEALNPRLSSAPIYLARACLHPAWGGEGTARSLGCNRGRPRPLKERDRFRPACTTPLPSPHLSLGRPPPAPLIGHAPKVSWCIHRVPPSLSAPRRATARSRIVGIWQGR